MKIFATLLILVIFAQCYAKNKDSIQTKKMCKQLTTICKKQNSNKKISSKCLKLESELNCKTDKKIKETKKRENKLTVRKRNKRALQNKCANVFFNSYLKRYYYFCDALKSSGLTCKRYNKCSWLCESLRRQGFCDKPFDFLQFFGK